MTATRSRPSALRPFSVLLLALPAAAQGNTPGEVLSTLKMSSTTGGFAGALADGDQWGSAIASIGDLDGDGVSELAVGAPGADDGGSSRGAVWIVFPDTTGMALFAQAISDTQGNFQGALDDFDRFGASVAGLGDLDGDGMLEIAVGAPGDDDGGSNRGAVYVLSLNVGGQVVSSQKISSTSGGFSGGLDNEDALGVSVANLGDLDEDGVVDLAVGASGDDDGGPSRGAVWILFLGSTGTVVDQQKISDIVGDFGGLLDDFDQFGNAVAGLGLFDGDTVPDMAVCAFGDDDGGPSHGAVWIIFLDADGTVDSYQKISSTEGGFGGLIENGDAFGISVGSLGDVDGNGVSDLAVGVLRDDDGGGPSRGAVWLLYMLGDGTVRGELKISETSGGFGAALDDFDELGFAVVGIGDLDDDGAVDMIACAPGDDDGGTDRGALYTLLLEGRFLAAFEDRLGSGTNPVCIIAVNAPVIGETWDILDTAAPSADVIILGVTAPLATPLPFAFGELLIDPFSETLFISDPPTNTHSLPVPNQPAIVGIEVYAQGIRIMPLELCNGIDATIGY